LEYLGDRNLGDEKARRQLEKQMAVFIKKETLKIVKDMQENNVDSLGIGKYVRNSLNQREWQKLNWREVYSHVEVDINTKVKIKNYGKFN
jgi:spore germination protein